MQKGYRILVSIFIILYSLYTANLKAQSLKYELFGNYPSFTDTPDTVKFTPYLNSGFDFCRLSFDVVPDATLVTDEIYVFTTPVGGINVTLHYTTTGGDCTAGDPNLTSTSIQIDPKLGHFSVGYDMELQNLATLKRVFRSSQAIDDNNFSEIGNLRFFWDFDVKMDPAPEVDFDENDPSQGQYPNVYYTFPNGGVYQITLNVVDVTSPSDTAVFSRILRLTPEFTDDLIDFENIPNVFTPSGSVNNFFKVETSGTNELSFKVFSRSGALVYQYKGNVIKWDGKNYYGQDLPTGIYYYLLEDASQVKKYNPAKGFFYIYR
jgi:gliding motility-associated-like protein